jgi:hypothetical protein
MSTFRRIIMVCALALSSIAPLSVTEAAPINPQPLNITKSTDVTPARIVCNDWGCRRVRRPPDYRPYRPYRPHYRPRVFIAPPPLIIAPPPRYYRPVGNRHVRWCLNHYRSYNPATNRYLAYDGSYRVCRSPFR